jgi:hypothetical protein
MIVDATGIDEDRVSVKETFGNVDLFFETVDGEDDVLEDLLREGHGSDPRRRCELEEGGFGWEEPTEEEAEDGMVPKRNHALNNPENGTVVPE